MRSNGKGNTASEIDTKFLRTILHYDVETGVFTWLVGNKRSVRAGDTANSLHKSTGYLRVKIKGRQFVLHRLAWQYVYGNHPATEIDHINGDRSDNRLSNLREATSANNNWNRKISVRNSSGKKGVCWNKKAGKWQAQIGHAYGRTYLGVFDTPEEAHRAYTREAKKLFGDFARAK